MIPKVSWGVLKLLVATGLRLRVGLWVDQVTLSL